MKFAVVGAGAIGGYLGAKLALAGEEVTFIARNRNLEAIRAHGFKLILEDGSEEYAPSAKAVQHMADAGPQDVVLLTTKAHQLLDLVPGMQALFGPETMVVSMVNGIPWWYFQKLGGAYEARQLRSVDPDGALSAGIDVKRMQWLAFIMAGGVAGLAGALYAFSKGSISPESLSVAKSVDGLVMVLLGGIQTLAGPVVGAFSFTWLHDVVARNTDYWRAMLGAIILILVLLFPQGIAGSVQGLWERLRSRSSTAGGAAP